MVTFGTSTLPGTRYGDLNQDHVEVHEMFSAQELAAQGVQQCYVIVVLDGHGLLGERCAKKAGHVVSRTLLGGALRCRPLESVGDDELQRIFEDAFYRGHQASLELYEDPPNSYVYPKGSPGADRYTLTFVNKVPMYHSRRLSGDRLLEFGATCTVALLQGRTLAVANVGDSGAVLGRMQGSTCSHQQLTVRHWGGNQEEVRRVATKHGSTIAFLREDGYLSIEHGQWRGYQLSMTRALGHKMLAMYGIIFNPSVQRFTLQADDFCLVVASDGLWDVFEDGEAVELVAKYVAEGLNAGRVANRLAREAIKVACSVPGCDADNTTCFVMLL